MKDELREILVRYEDIIKLCERVREDEVACSYLSKVRKMLEAEIDLLVLETTGKMEKPSIYRVEKDFEDYMLSVGWIKDKEDNNPGIRLENFSVKIGDKYMDRVCHSWAVAKQLMLEGWKVSKIEKW